METSFEPRPELEQGKTRVDVGDLAVSNRAGETLIAYALGSCVGVVVYDPRCCVGGLAHVQLPSSGGRPDTTRNGLWSFADQAVPELFHRCYQLGAKKQGMKVVLAGGASILDPSNFFEIGRKNYLICKKLLWQNGVLLTAERIGGQDWRTVSVEMATGKIVIKTQKSQEEF